nr:PREDICTED: arylacetamide deacetylase-like 3 isoform X2 [Anolis carolinensis]|eukprot:XP_016853946.1 PREDICTED: arylacetamide deacetylase-like 3 isoform X2 [Anolis carolinensis]
MELGSALWGLVSYLSLSALFLLLAWGIYYDITRTHVPTGIQEYTKLRFYNFLSNYALRLGILYEKLGICRRYTAWRTMCNGIPPLRKNSALIIKDLLFDGVPVRVYWPKTESSGNRRGMVYLHGGVGLFGSITYERVNRYISRRSDSVVVCVGFRLAPEHPFPVPVLDCCTATIHFLRNATKYGVDPNRIAVCGDSSGGTFAAAVCQHLATKKDLPKLRAQILIYPFLQAVDFNLPSYQQNHSIPVLFKKRAIQLGVTYLTGRLAKVDGLMKNAHVPQDLLAKYKKWVSADHIPDEFKARGYVPLEPVPFCEELYELYKEGFQPMFSPLLAEDDVVRRLPETFLLTCEYDVVRDDGLLYKKRLEDNGVPVTWHHVKDGFHGMMFLIDFGPFEFKCTRPNFRYLINFIKCL